MPMRACLEDDEKTVMKILHGYPTALIPPALLDKSTNAAVLTKVKKVVAGILRDKPKWVVFPRAMDEHPVARKNKSLQYRNIAVE